jgi:RNA polymerase sigma-70 factor (ECF subfamily)
VRLQNADAEEIQSAVFEAVVRRIRDFDLGREGASFRGWLWTITRSKIADKANQAKKGPAAVGGSDWPNVLVAISTPDEPETEKKEMLQLLRRAVTSVLHDFDESTRKAFLLKVMGSRPAQEVARIVGISANAVYLAVARVKRRLRDEFSGLLEV